MVTDANSVEAWELNLDVLVIELAVHQNRNVEQMKRRYTLYAHILLRIKHRLINICVEDVYLFLRLEYVLVDECFVKSRRMNFQSHSVKIVE